MPLSCPRFVRARLDSSRSRIFSPGALIKYGFVELVILFPRAHRNAYIYISISDKASVHSCCAQSGKPFNALRNNVAAIHYYHVRFGRLHQKWKIGPIFQEEKERKKERNVAKDRRRGGGCRFSGRVIYRARRN